MGLNRHKELTFPEYLALYHDRRADNLTVSQLQQVLFIHGIQKRSLSCKDEIMDAVHSLVLMPATRSTINSDIVQPICESTNSAVYLEEAKQDIRDLGWLECPIGSIVAVPDKPTSSPTNGKRKRKRKKTRVKKIKDEKHDSPSSLSEEGVTNGPKESKSEVKKTIHVLATSLKDVDNSSWINNGSQMVKGFTAPRAYYGCKKPGCQVMKYVDYDPNNPSMCIVTYKGEHNHAIS